MPSYKPDWATYSIDVKFEPISAQKDQKAENFLVLDTPELYQEHIVSQLLFNGEMMQKTARIFAWPMGMAAEWGTKDISGNAETIRQTGNHTVSENPKDNAKSELFVVFSEHEFNYPQAIEVHTKIHEMAAIAKYSLSQEDTQKLLKGQMRYKLNTQAYGMWTMDAYSLNDKYNHSTDKATPNIYSPKPESMRFIAPIDVDGYEGIEMPTTWGSFKVRNGGHIAIAAPTDDKDETGYQQLIRSVELRNDFIVNTADGVRSVLDIYGIEPNFVKNNYKSALGIV